MKCARAKNWLLNSEPLMNAPADVADHMRTCSICQRSRDDLARLERNYRCQPLPPSAWTSQARFLRRLQPRHLRSPRLRWLAAALLMLAFGGVLWLAGPGPQVQAASNVLDRLIEWNLTLAAVKPGPDRQILHAQRATLLDNDLRVAVLSPEDRELAQQLFQFGSWQVINNDPLEEAERFALVADQLMERLQSAKIRKQPQDSDRFARQYRRIAEQGLTIKLDLAMKVKNLDHQKKNRLEKLLAKNARRLEALHQISEQLPDAPRKELRKALDHGRKHQRKQGLTYP